MKPLKPRFVHSPESGFTLIEALVVIIMVAVLMGIAAPSWLAYLNRQRVGAVQGELAEVFKQAQTNAQQLRSTQTVVIDTAAERPTVRVNGIEQTLGSNNIPPGTIVMAVVPDTTITFDYQGTPDAPFIVDIRTENATSKRCVAMVSLVGSIATASDADCDTLDALVNPE